jgi:hypothetical protein
VTNWNPETTGSTTYADESAVSSTYTGETVTGANFNQEQLGILAANGGGTPIGMLLTITTSGDLYYDNLRWSESGTIRTDYTESSQ